MGAAFEKILGLACSEAETRESNSDAYRSTWPIARTSRAIRCNPDQHDAYAAAG